MRALALRLLAVGSVLGATAVHARDTGDDVAALVQAVLEDHTTVNQVIGAILADCHCAPPAVAPSTQDAAPSIDVGSAGGAPGDQVTFAVTLNARGASVAGAQNDLAFDSINIPIAARPTGEPDCTVNPSINKDLSGFAFNPVGCSGSACTMIRALIIGFNLDPIPDGSVLYTCNVDISSGAANGAYSLQISNVMMATPQTQPVPGATGTDGVITVGGTRSTPTITNTPAQTPTNTPTSTNTPVAISGVELRADTGGVFGGRIRLRTILDEPSFGDALETLRSDGLTVAVSGAGLAAPETMAFLGAACFDLHTMIQCIGSRAEVAVFKRRRRSSGFNVTITARGRSFQPPLTTEGVTLDLSLGAQSLHGLSGSCEVRGRRRAVALCRM